MSDWTSHKDIKPTAKRNIIITPSNELRRELELRASLRGIPVARYCREVLIEHLSTHPRKED